MRVHVIGLLLVLLLCGSASAAEVTWDPSWGCDAEYSGSQCEGTVGDEGENLGGGKYTYCIAKKSQGQLCQDVVTIYTPAETLCATGCRTCASVQFSASCACDSYTLELTGSCTYW